MNLTNEQGIVQNVLEVVVEDDVLVQE